MSDPVVTILAPNGLPARESMSYQGAGAGFGGVMRDWTPSLQSADAALLPQLELGNARAEDVVRNNAFAANGVQMHIDNIVGHLFRLSYKPMYKRLGVSEADARAFATDVEQAWLEIAEDPIGCHLDAERKRTFTMMIREGIGTHTRFGELTAAAEWINRNDSPIKTAIKLVSPKRLSNPNKRNNSDKCSGGIEHDRHGAPVAYWLRDSGIASLGYGTGLGQQWKRISKTSKFGRLKFMHVFEPTEHGQSRGSNPFLAVMEQMHMLPKLQSTKLQNAIVNAMYAAVIESELDTGAAMELIGSEKNINPMQAFLETQMAYHNGANVKMNGVKIPHLVPGEKLSLQTSGNVDNGFTELEGSILRWMSAGLNVPYEAFAKDYRNSSYSSARASMLEGWRYYMGRRKIIASKFASMIFGLVFEELLHSKQITLPRSATRGFYEAKGAWLNASWIGAGRMAIDGLKEVKESVMRIEGGLSTYEKELALLGEDYQEVFAQQVRESKERKEAGLPRASWVREEVSDDRENM
jgi:lambda family phage portal protein